MILREREKEIKEKGIRIKIGARILSEEEAKNQLPSYEKIYMQIENFRQKANEKYNESKGYLEDDSQDKIMDQKKDFNNIISILGDRGSGKTSILFTIRNNCLEKKKNENKDIVFPVIIPEDMGEVSDPLGWIITRFEEEVKELGEKISKERPKTFTHCRRNGEANIFSKMNELRQSYYLRKKQYQKIVVNEFVNKSEYLDDNKEVLKADSSFKENLNKVINEIIKVKIELGDSIAPLIIFFFDDVDICPQRGPELLDILLRYLSHPNVVTFIAGDYKEFEESNTIQLLTKENLLESKLMDKVFVGESINNNLEEENVTDSLVNSALNIRKKRTYHHLKKILPPAYRYEMAKLTEKQRAEFKYYNIEANEKENEIQLPSLIRLFEILLLNGYKKFKKEDLFFYYERQYIYNYFKIFDDTPRGMLNIYNFLYEKFIACEDNCTLEKEEIIKLLKILIDSSYVLSKYEGIIQNIIDLYYKEESSEQRVKYYINYRYFNELMESEKYNRDDLLKLFILANFFEGILSAVNGKKFNNTHGSEELYKILNMNYEQNNLIPKINNVQFLLKLDYLLEESFTAEARKEIGSNQQGYILAEYFNILKKMKKSKIKNESNLYNIFNYFYQNDDEWVIKKLDKLFEFYKEDEEIYKENYEKLIIEFNDININYIGDYLHKGCKCKRQEWIKDLHTQLSEYDKDIIGFKKDNLEQLIYKLKNILNSALTYNKYLSNFQEIDKQKNGMQMEYNSIIEDIKKVQEDKSLSIIDDDLRNEISIKVKFIKNRKNVLQDIFEKYSKYVKVEDDNPKLQVKNYTKNETYNNKRYFNYDSILIGDREDLIPDKLKNVYIPINKKMMIMENKENEIPRAHKELIKEYYKLNEIEKFLEKFIMINLEDMKNSVNNLEKDIELMNQRLNKLKADVQYYRKQIDSYLINLECLEVTNNKFLIHEINRLADFIIYLRDKITAKDAYFKVDIDNQYVLNMIEVLGKLTALDIRTRAFKKYDLEKINDLNSEKVDYNEVEQIKLIFNNAYIYWRKVIVDIIKKNDFWYLNSKQSNLLVNLSEEIADIEIKDYISFLINKRDKVSKNQIIHLNRRVKDYLFRRRHMGSLSREKILYIIDEFKKDVLENNRNNEEDQFNVDKHYSEEVLKNIFGDIVHINTLSDIGTRDNIESLNKIKELKNELKNEDKYNPLALYIQEKIGGTRDK